MKRSKGKEITVPKILSKISQKQLIHKLLLTILLPMELLLLVIRKNLNTKKRRQINIKRRRCFTNRKRLCQSLPKLRHL